MDAVGRPRQIAPDQLEITEGGGCLSLFGLPFLTAGIFVALIGARIVPVENARQVPGWAWPLIFLMGLAFVAVGGGLVLGRRWLILDTGRGKILKRWGLLFPMQGEERSLQGYDAVLLGFEPGDSDSADRYPVLLRAADGGAGFPLVSSTQFGESREQAAAVARFLRLPLVDASTDHAVVIGTERLDETFVERARSGDGRLDEAPRPLRMRCLVRESSRGVEVVIPGPGFPPGKLVGLVLSAGLFAYIAPGLLEFFRRTRTPEGVQIAFLAFVAAVLIAVPLLGIINAAVLARRGRTLVTASPEGIVIEERTAWRARTTRIPAADILGLDYATVDAALQSAGRLATQRAAQAARATPAFRQGGESPRWLALLRRLATSKGILVKSRSGITAIGAGLPDEEVRYLFAAVARAVGGEAGRRW